MSDTAKTVTVSLNTPLKHGTEEIAELTFRKPRAGDMRGIEIAISEGGIRFDMGALLDLAARLAGVPPMVIDQAELDDVARIVEAVAPLLPASLVAGG